MKQAAIIVAHPDDEIIWCGGLILRNLDWDWTVLSLCRATDPDRRTRFRGVCESLGVAGCIGDLDDDNPLKAINPAREIGRRIRECLGGADWDLCLTHGAKGEYGHPRHIEVHNEVRRLMEAAVLRCDELWTFAYRCHPRTGECRARPDADVLVTLTPAELVEKKRIVHEQYGYAPDSFEVRACISPEAFHRHDPTWKVSRP
jgi:LmbE family N-acetylglucosaminyl deacetylase